MFTAACLLTLLFAAEPARQLDQTSGEVQFRTEPSDSSGDASRADAARLRQPAPRPPAVQPPPVRKAPAPAAAAPAPAGTAASSPASEPAAPAQPSAWSRVEKTILGPTGTWSTALWGMLGAALSAICYGAIFAFMNRTLRVGCLLFVGLALGIGLYMSKSPPTAALAVSVCFQFVFAGAGYALVMRWRNRAGGAAPAAAAGDAKGRTTHGSARWASLAEVLGVSAENPAGVALGYDARAYAAPPRRRWFRKPTPAPDSRLRVSGHVLTLARTGAGKGVSCAIPACLEWGSLPGQGSLFALDIKGELVETTARQRRAMGQDVFVLDPYGVTNQASAHLNWLDTLDPRDESVVSKSELLAEMCVIPGNENQDSHWDETAKGLIQGVILHVATYTGEARVRRNMGEVRRILTLNEEDLERVLQVMAASDACFDILRRAANSFMGTEDREKSAILSTARRHTRWLDDPPMARVLSKSDFRLQDLKTKPMSVFVAIPPDRLDQSRRFLRGVVGLTLSALTATESHPAGRILVLLDEAMQLGHLRALATSFPLVRSYGVTYWLFVQDLGALQGNYKATYKTFLTNSTIQAFGLHDLDTAKWISGCLGESTVSWMTEGKSRGGKELLGHKSQTEHVSGRPLLKPDEVLRHAHVIALVANQPPYELARLNYLKNGWYEGQWDENASGRQARGAAAAPKLASGARPALPAAQPSAPGPASSPPPRSHLDWLQQPPAAAGEGGPPAAEDGLTRLGPPGRADA